MKKVLISGLGLMLLGQAYALDYEKHLALGLNIDTYRDDLPPAFDYDHKVTFAPTLGLKGIALWGNVGIRSGLFLEWKKVKGDFDAPSNSKVDLTAYYLTVPINLQFNLNEKWAIFGGVTPHILLSKTCEDCDDFDDDPNIIVNYANGGITYEMSDSWSLDVSFQHALGDNFKDLKISTAQVMLLLRI